MVTIAPRSRAIRSRPARIVSVCVAGHPVAQERFNTNRIELVSKVAREIRRRPDWDPLDAVLLPAGFFRLGTWFGPLPAEVRLELLFLEEIADVCRGAAYRLSKRSPGCIIVAGIDTPRPGGGWRGDQLTAAFDMDGVVGLARKVFPVSQDTDGWGRAPYLLFADDYGSFERFVRLANGQTALLSTCYDAFVLSELALGPTHKRSAMRYLGVDTDDGWEHLDAAGRDALLGELKASIRQRRPSVHLVAIHGFKRPGGELLWQRHGLATSSAALKGALTVGAAHFTESLPSTLYSAPLSAAGVAKSHLGLGAHRPACELAPIDGFETSLAWDRSKRALVRLYQAD